MRMQSQSRQVVGNLAPIDKGQFDGAAVVSTSTPPELRSRASQQEPEAESAQQHDRVSDRER
ncbi:hypothetical protein EJB05_54800, partial [Eragrostis curvula]